MDRTAGLPAPHLHGLSANLHRSLGPFFPEAIGIDSAIHGPDHDTIFVADRPAGWDGAQGLLPDEPSGLPVQGDQDVGTGPEHGVRIRGDWSRQWSILAQACRPEQLAAQSVVGVQRAVVGLCEY